MVEEHHLHHHRLPTVLEVARARRRAPGGEQTNVSCQQEAAAGRRPGKGWTVSTVIQAQERLHNKPGLANEHSKCKCE